MSKEVIEKAIEALDNTDSAPGSEAWEREKDAMIALEKLAEQPAQQEPNLPSQIGRLIEAANHAASKGLVSGTTNWAATVARYMMANAMQPEQRKPLTPTEVHGMAEAHGIDGDARHWYVVGLVDAQAKHNIKENT